MKQAFECHWEHTKYFPVIKLKNMKALFNNLGIEMLDMKEESVERNVHVTFYLEGTEDQQESLDFYMSKINTLP